MSNRKIWERKYACGQLEDNETYYIRDPGGNRVIDNPMSRLISTHVRVGWFLDASDSSEGRERRNRWHNALISARDGFEGR